MNKDIETAVKRSQRCQRNWDLNKTIPDNDLQTIVTAATECPSKQNIDFYQVHVVRDREIIEDIHDNTFFENDYDDGKGRTNPQVLANVVLAFTKNDITKKDQNQEVHDWSPDTLEKDLHQSVGVAAGMVNLSASLMGYQTGCCACFKSDEIKNILGTEQEPVLLMGVGFRDEDKNRRQHHVTDDMIPSFNKEIKVNYL